MRTLGVGWNESRWLPIALLAVLASSACVGSGNSKGGVDAACVVCGDGTCFDCGSGCICSDAMVGFDAGVWQPPFVPAMVGEDGWQRSTSRFCPGPLGFGEPDLWSDARGVYVLLSRTDTDFADFGARSASRDVDDERSTPRDLADKALPIFDAGEPGGFGGGGGGAGISGFGGFGGFGGSTGFATHDTVFHNDGDGWNVIARLPHGSGHTSPRRLSGMPDGPLALHGDNSGFGSGCALSTLENDTETCVRQTGFVPTFFSTGSEAFAALERFVLHYDGSDWSALSAEASNNIRALWADADQVVAGSDPGSIMRLDRATGTWSETPSAAFVAIQSVWALGDKVYGGSFGGELVQVDGETAEVIYRSSDDHLCFADSLVSVWGVDDTLYFYTRFSLHRRVAGQTELIATWDCERPSLALTRVWGSSANEVFLAFMDEDRRFSDACGGAYVLFFDGTRFHVL